MRFLVLQRSRGSEKATLLLGRLILRLKIRGFQRKNSGLSIIDLVTLWDEKEEMINPFRAFIRGLPSSNTQSSHFKISCLEVKGVRA